MIYVVQLYSLYPMAKNGHRDTIETTFIATTNSYIYCLLIPLYTNT